MEPCGKLLVIQFVQVFAAAAQGLVHKVRYLLELCRCVFATVKQAQVIKDLVLCGNKYAGQKFLVCYGIGLEMIRYHVVYVLDEYYISIQVIEVLNQRAVTARTEQY